MRTLVERVAARLCYERGLWPFDLEPGNAWGVDAILPNGDPAHEHWRRFVETAERVVRMTRGTDAVDSR